MSRTVPHSPRGLCALVLALVLASSSVLAEGDSPVDNAAEDGRIRLVSFSFTIRNTHGEVVPSAEFRVAAPVKRTAFQECLKIRATRDFELIEDKLGNQTLLFRLADVAPYAVVPVGVEAELRINPEPAGERTPPGEYLLPQRLVESQSPEIAALAARLKDPGLMLKWVSKEVGGLPGTDTVDRGALHAFKTRKGDCTESACLLAALGRAAGFPSRVMRGYVCPRDMKVDPAMFHDWTETLLDGHWRPADPRKGVDGDACRGHIAFIILADDPESPLPGGRRFGITGEGLSVLMD